jgi:hypothetical protein
MITTCQLSITNWWLLYVTTYVMVLHNHSTTERRAVSWATIITLLDEWCCLLTLYGYQFDPIISQRSWCLSGHYLTMTGGWLSGQNHNVLAVSRLQLPHDGRFITFHLHISCDDGPVPPVLTCSCNHAAMVNTLLLFRETCCGISVLIGSMLLAICDWSMQ